MNRGVAVLAAVLLAGCEPAFDVDFVANAPVDGSTVTLRLDGVDLGRVDGGTETRTRGQTGEFRFQRELLATPADLLSNSDIDGGEYDSIRLRFAIDEGAVQRSGLATEFIEIGANDDADVAFMIDGDEDDRVSLTVALDLILSLRENQDETGFTLDPVIRAMDRADAASVEGTVAASLISGVDCGALARPAVYAYLGSDVEPDERDGANAEPIAVSEISRAVVGAPGSYVLNYLAPATYTLALTCQSQLENGTQPALDGANIVFFEPRNLELEAGEQALLNFP